MNVNGLELSTWDGGYTATVNGGLVVFERLREHQFGATLWRVRDHNGTRRGVWGTITRAVRFTMESMA